MAGRSEEARGWYEGLNDPLFTTDSVFYHSGRPGLALAYEHTADPASAALQRSSISARRAR